VVGVLSTAVPDTSVTSFPFGSFAVAKAVLLLYQHQYPLELYVPLITELEAPASVAIGFPVIVNPIIGSVTTTLVRVVFPVLVTAKVYVIIPLYLFHLLLLFSQEQYLGLS
jgi:hypothetical protein